MSDPICGVAVVPPGLEEPAAAELEALDCLDVEPHRRAVGFRTDLAGYYRLHLQARLPFRLLRQLARFPCRNRQELYAGVQARSRASRSGSSGWRQRPACGWMPAARPRA
jgi:putative N6-adenine-specific DNA methylase